MYLGGYSVGVPPLPIPNREVKPFSADGTAIMWESRSPPFLIIIYLSLPVPEISSGPEVFLYLSFSLCIQIRTRACARSYYNIGKVPADFGR